MSASATVAAVAGPVLPAASIAPPAAKRGITVEPLAVVAQALTVTVRVALAVSAPGSKVQEPAVPVFVKSEAATPVTASENSSMKVTVPLGAMPARSAANVATVGAVVS